MALNIKIAIEWNKITPTSNSYQLEKNNFEYQEINTLLDLKVFVYKSDGSKIEITEDPALNLLCLDENVIQFVKHPLFPTIQSRKALLFKKQGSGIIKAIWNTGNNFVTSQEFISYQIFLKDKYLNYFVTNYDKNIILSNDKLRIMFDCMMEFLDIIYAYKSDILRINDIDNIKSTFLNHFGKSLGFERVDNNSIDTDKEKMSNIIYKEILKNLFELIKLRGTKLSYQLFFSALGYDDLVIEEFWWSKDGKYLIQLNEGENSILPNLSPNPLVSLRGYSLNGNALYDDPSIREEDPRAFNSSNNDYNITQKSNYIRIKSAAFSDGNNKALLKKYLNFLKPLHIEYLPEVGIINIFNGNTDTYIIPNINLDEVLEIPYIDLDTNKTEMNADLFYVHSGNIPDILSPEYEEYKNSNIFENLLVTEITNFPPKDGETDTSKPIEIDTILDNSINDYEDTFNWNESDDLVIPEPEIGKYNIFPNDYTGITSASKAIPLPLKLFENILWGLFIELETSLESSAFKYDIGLKYDQIDKWEGKYDSKGIFIEDLIIEKILK